MTETFHTVRGAVAALPQSNIDTDVIMPKVFLKGIDRTGLARGVFHDLRFGQDGTPDPGFVLNRPGWSDCRFLVVGPNFGTGSSREHAVWGLLQYGIRAIIGSSFAGIFADNCKNNGLLLISLAEDPLAALMQAASSEGANMLEVSLDPPQVTVLEQSRTYPFEISQTIRTRLMQGQDHVAATLERAAEITAFEAAHFEQNPWFKP